MTKHAQIRMLFHGTVILLGSMLAGFPLAVVAGNGSSPEVIHAWVVTHASFVSSAILLIAIGAAARHLVLSPRQATLFSWTMLGSVYLLCTGLIFSAITGLRGLTPDGPPLNVALHVCNIIGVLGALVANVLLVRGAYASLRAEAPTVASPSRQDERLALHRS